MAVEKDPGSQPEKPKAAPSVDHEARARDLEAKLAAEQQAREQERQQLAAALQDPEVVKNLAARVTGGQPQAAATDDGDEGTLVDRRELKRHMEQVSRQTANVVIETTARSAKQIRAAHLRAKAAEDPKFKKHQGEVTRLLDQMDPLQSSDPETIEKVYQVVRSNHLKDEEDEVRAEVRRQTLEELRARGVDVPDDEDEETDEEPEVAASPGRSGRPAGAASRQAAAPASAGSPSRVATSRRQQNTRTLTRDEKIAANIFNLTEEEYIRYHPNSGWKPDLMGFKGRTRI